MKKFLLSVLLLAAFFLNGKEPQDLLRDKALKGDLYAMVSLGDEFFRGEKRPRNRELAAYWYRKAALGKLPLGLYRYGVCLEFGWGVKADSRQAFENYLQAGTFGAAQLRIAEMLLEGVPAGKDLPAVPKDPFKAVTIMRDLCKANYYPALLKLAKLLYSNPEWKKVHAKEIYTLTLQSTNASPIPPESLLFQARLLQEGVGVEQDDVFARALLEIAARAGNSEAEFLFAQCLEFGKGTSVNKEKAFQYYKKSADQNFPAAVLRMGDYHLAGEFVAHDPGAALNNYLSAAEKKFPPALRKSAWCYENGIGTEKDMDKAFNFYERSADAGDPLGNYHTGRCFLEGIGVKADPAGAFFFFRRSALAGCREGMIALAECLRTGKGCTPDPAMAERWLKLAEKQ